MKKIKELFIKYKEIITYIIFGVVTTIVNWCVYAIMVRIFGIDLDTVQINDNVIWSMFTGSSGRNLTLLLISNIIAWLAGVIVAFVTNKIWVFESKVRSFGGVAKEFLMFTGARLVTGVMEWFGIPLLVIAGMNQSLFGIQGFPAKIVVSVVVIILNYVFSKLFVFGKKSKKAE